MKKYNKPTVEVFEVRATEAIAAPGKEGWETAPITKYDMLAGVTSAAVGSHFDI